MKKFLLQALSQAGDVSMTRLMAFMCVTCAIIIALVGVYKGSNLNDVAMLVGSFLAPAFMGKVAQKKTETEV